MNYHVYRINREGKCVLTAQCQFYPDARAVLNNWHAGFILIHGSVMYPKNIPEGFVYPY